MKANPDKFQAIAVGKKTHDKYPKFEIDNNIISCDDVTFSSFAEIEYCAWLTVGNVPLGTIMLIVGALHCR